MRVRLVLIFFLFAGKSLFAQLQSPAEFLGYELGNRFTQHYKIVNYFRQAAAAMPQMMKLEKYGETNEGRELLVAIVTAPGNFSRLEEIRKNNLRLTGLLNDQPADLNAPAIIWLSYNVHGNEPSSSEVAMKTLFELLNPANAQTKEWLKNTVVIIDPCLNPDGRDRYVNWFTQMIGKNPNANADSREHSEPWPGGRTNHYNFDLNRDWAWQTQVETRQRIKKYNEWMPQVHCDYHEQYPNNPYYFAPAAEPFHEVITPWQREFQTTIGKNHAKYFDANGWLYFTREIFDLFYPSYGDTYPTYNGAIGMTYEQAGHSPGGLAIVLNDGDTLTLKDRIAHHFTTSMSTIEITSKNNSRVIKEFKKFFDDANTNSIGEYKSYTVTSEKADRLYPLISLLEKNMIRYQGLFDEPVTGRGYNYFSAKEENIESNKWSIIINGNQPKAALIKVLFEPNSKLSDSATYDITAWSLPFAYGLKTYACKEKIMAPKNKASSFDYNINIPAYAYLFPYSSFNSAKLLTRFLSNGIKLRMAEKDFVYDKRKFTKGALIVLISGNETKMEAIKKIMIELKPEYNEVASGFMESGFDFGSEKVHFLKKPNVAMLTGSGIAAGSAGEVWHLFEQELDYPITLINADDIGGVSWKNIDVLILPDGNYKFLSNKEGSADLKTWVKQGGKIIALENAVSQMAAGDWGIKIKKSEEDDKDKKEDSARNMYSNLKKYENREREGIVNNIPGAIYKMELDNSHPLAFGYPDFYFSLKQNDNLYEFMRDGWNVGVLKKNKQVAGFVGSRIKEKIKDGTVIGTLSMGNGSIAFFADDPIFRSFWENGKLLMANAVFLVGQ